MICLTLLAYLRMTSIGSYG